MKNSRVYLRALQIDDYKTTFKWRNNDDVWSSVVGPKYFVSPDYEKKWVEAAIFDKENIRLAICLKEKDAHIGNAYLEEIDWINRNAKAGILIGEKKYWGSGYGTEAMFLFFSFIFFERGLHRITAEILESNKIALKHFEKIGGIREGVLREAIYKNGKYHNLVIASILKDDFRKKLKIFE